MPRTKFKKSDIQKARGVVADNAIKSAHEIRKGDYASHVTEDKKEEILQEDLKQAELIRSGKLDHNFTIWQRMQYVLTGECIPFLPPEK